MDPITIATRHQVTTLLLVVSLISGGVLAFGQMNGAGATPTLWGSTQLRLVLPTHAH